MAWVGISIVGRTDLHIIRKGNLMTQRYTDEILRPHVVPYAAIFGDSFVLMQGNVRYLTARHTDQLIGTLAHASQCPMTTFTGMDTVGPDPHGLGRGAQPKSVGGPSKNLLNSDGKKRTSELSKIEAELILEANRLQLMKQDLEKAENAYLSSFTSKKSKTLPGATAAAHGDPNGKNDYQKKGVETINVRFDENKRGINFKQKVNSNLGYNLNLPDYYDDKDDFDRVKDSLTSRLVSKTSTEMPSTSEKPEVSSDNHSLIPCTERAVRAAGLSKCKDFIGEVLDDTASVTNLTEKKHQE
ncbi:hypothetical protein TNCV_5071591 [Trichonephila clavipes]|nr:hypothetical protein TNCV_5071591 [Trichonephila clavipes]